MFTMLTEIIILTHIRFFGLLIALLTLSTLIDIIRGTYSPFGTQHVALLLSAYSPIIVFSHSPGVVKHLKFWRR